MFRISIVYVKFNNANNTPTILSVLSDFFVGSAIILFDLKISHNKRKGGIMYYAKPEIPLTIAVSERNDFLGVFE